MAEVEDRPLEANGRPRIALVTGATSQLGRLVVEGLVARGFLVRAVVRDTSPEATGLLRGAMSSALSTRRLDIVAGDIRKPDLGLEREVLATFGAVTHVVHLARPRAAEKAAAGALVLGLDNVLGLARRIGPGPSRLVVLSTTAVMGEYPGRFYEDWLDVGQRLRTAAAEAAMELETRARTAARHLPVVVVRHGLLVGDRRTGRIECGAGLGPLFAAGPLLGQLPSFVPIPGIAEGPRFVNVSPVDYVAEGIVEIAASDLVRPTSEGATFCLADAKPPTLSELWDLLLDRVGAGEAWLRIPVEGGGPLGRTAEVAGRLGTTVARLLDRGGGPSTALSQRGEHDVRNALELLEPAHIVCPRLETYLDALYEDYLARRKRSS